MLLGVSKAKISPQSLKTEFWAQNQYGRVQGRTGFPNFGGMFLDVKKAKISSQGLNTGFDSTQIGLLGISLQSPFRFPFTF
jgi:hypothetical protein